MSAGCTLLDPSDVQRGGSEIHLLPPQVHQLRSAQAVPVGNQDYRGVAVPPTVLPSRVHQSLDFAVGQVLASVQLAVWQTLRVTVRFTVAGETSLRCRLAMRFAFPALMTVRIMLDRFYGQSATVFVDLSSTGPFRPANVMRMSPTLYFKNT